MASKPDLEAWVDGHRVVFYRGAGWDCGCEAFRSHSECTHSVKAAALLTWGRPMASHNEASDQNPTGNQCLDISH